MEGGHETFGQMLKIFRRRKGLTQKQVAGRINISGELLSQYERGIVPRMKMDRAEQLLDVLDVHDTAERSQFLLLAAAGWDDRGEPRVIGLVISDVRHTKFWTAVVSTICDEAQKYRPPYRVMLFLHNERLDLMAAHLAYLATLPMLAAVLIAGAPGSAGDPTDETRLVREQIDRDVALLGARKIPMVLLDRQLGPTPKSRELSKPRYYCGPDQKEVGLRALREITEQGTATRVAVLVDSMRSEPQRERFEAVRDQIKQDAESAHQGNPEGHNFIITLVNAEPTGQRDWYMSGDIAQRADCLRENLQDILGRPPTQRAHAIIATTSYGAIECISVMQQMDIHNRNKAWARPRGDDASSHDQGPRYSSVYDAVDIIVCDDLGSARRGGTNAPGKTIVRVPYRPEDLSRRAFDKAVILRARYDEDDAWKAEEWDLEEMARD